MRHQGVAFPPEYEPRGLSVKIENNTLQLEPLQEEMLMAWAKKIGTPYVDDPVFQENFLGSLRERWRDAFDNVSIGDIDLREMQEIADREKLANMPEARRKQVSAERKKIREELKAKYGYATVDGIEVEIGAYLVEPPGIFMGRGAHPLRGKWKKRVVPEEVELNLDEDSPRPTPNYPGAWKAIVHEHDGLWVARWKDELADKLKYVWLAETSPLRQEREKEKFVKATHLAESLDAVREKIREGMRSKHEKTRKAATVCYLIDRLAMRVGDEKDEDEADTVGASTLRCEHVQIFDDHIEFDFLGKDSVRWQKALAISGDDRVLARNLREFKQGKPPEQQIFPEVRSAQVNKFLNSIVPGLTAKVFRTFHATTTVKTFLDKQGRVKSGAPPYEKEYVAKLANLQAAIACNHKRTVPKTWAESLKKKKRTVKQLRAQKPDMQKLNTQVEKREAALKRWLEDQKKFQAESPKQLEQKQAALQKLDARPKPKARKEIGARNRRIRELRAARRELKQSNAEKAKRYRERIQQARELLQKAKDARDRAKEKYEGRVERAQLQFELAKRTRDYNLNTSLKNYIDPRVYRAWGEQVDFDWTRLYPTTLQRKFAWAIEEANGDGSAAESVEREAE